MKIALCLHGLIGSKHQGKSWSKHGGEEEVIEKCAASFSKHLLSKMDVDVFFHNWEEEYENQLVEKFHPKLYKIEPQKVWSDEEMVEWKPYQADDERVQAHYSRWYSVKEVNKLKNQYESENNFKYDFVMLSRFDMIWTRDIFFNTYIPSYFYIPGTHDTHGLAYGWPNSHHGNEVADLWQISNSENMDKFCTLYDYITSYINEGCPTWKGISSHMLVKYHLQKLDLLPNKTKVLYDDMSSYLGDFLLYRTYVEKLNKIKL
tara:strand:+ start:728 stop:1510 length:783 start_codon:yes stop_codon:yes gene_type:complete